MATAPDRIRTRLSAAQLSREAAARLIHALFTARPDGRSLPARITLLPLRTKAGRTKGDAMAGNIVTVSSDSEGDALSEPVFIIEKNGVYYLTLALWGYDPSQATTPEQQQGVGGIAQLFQQNPKLQAAEVTSRGLVDIFEATDPPHQ